MPMFLKIFGGGQNPFDNLVKQSIPSKCTHDILHIIADIHSPQGTNAFSGLGTATYTSLLLQASSFQGGW